MEEEKLEFETLQNDENLTEEELIQKYGEIPENIMVEPLDHTLEEAENNGFAKEGAESEISEQNI